MSRNTFLFFFAWACGYMLTQSTGPGCVRRQHSSTTVLLCCIATLSKHMYARTCICFAAAWRVQTQYRQLPTAGEHNSAARAWWSWPELRQQLSPACGCFAAPNARPCKAHAGAPFVVAVEMRSSGAITGPVPNNWLTFWDAFGMAELSFQICSCVHFGRVYNEPGRFARK